MRLTGQLTSGDAVAWIGVTSPSSPHRLESMRAGTFHIGRGKSCHLRLGDPAIPDLLAVIVADRVSARISCQASSPQLLLNGEPIEDSPLSDGDLLEAGPYTLVFRRLPNDAVLVSSDEDVVLDAETASASQLVDALEEELSVIEELEHRPTRGWQELARRLTDSDASDSADTGEPDVIPIHDVHAILRSLEHGQQSLRLQQESILRELAELRRVQNRLADALLTAEDSVVPIRASESMPQRRASA